MELTATRVAPRTIMAAEVVTLIGFVLYVGLPDSVRAAGAALLGVGALAVVGCAGVRLWGTRVRAGVTVVAAASAVGLIGAVVYLSSLSDEPTAIPLGGVGVLLLSLVGIVVTAIILATGGRKDAS